MYPWLREKKSPFTFYPAVDIAEEFVKSHCDEVREEMMKVVEGWNRQEYEMFFGPNAEAREAAELDNTVYPPCDVE